MHTEINTPRPVKVFFSYSPNDERLKKELENHLAPLKHRGDINTWDEQRILAGDEKKKEIAAQFESANLILLLLSPSFMASDYCYTVEMPRALEKRESGEAKVIPIRLKAVDLRMTPFQGLQVIPKDGNAIEGRFNRNKVLKQVVEEVAIVVEILQARNT